MREAAGGVVNEKINDHGSLEARILQEDNSERRRGKEIFALLITDVILFVSVCACISGLWSDLSLFSATMIGAPFLALRLLRLINVRVFGIAWLAAIAAVVVFLIVFHSSFADGFKLLANELFDIGEEQQGYLYDRFEVAPGTAYGGRLICAGILSAFFAIGLTLAGRPLVRLFTALGLFVFSVFVCAYFGIAPVYMAVIGMLVSPVMYFIASSGVSFRGFLIGALLMGAVIAAAGLITRAAAPDKNFAVSETEEQLRDFFAGRTVHFSNMSTETDSDEKKDDKSDEYEDDPMKDEAEPPGQTGGSINGVTLLFIIIAIAVILLLLFIPAVILDKAKKKREKNREGMDSEDNNTAIRSHFIYLMRWFGYKGWCSANEFFEDAIPAIEEGMSPDYANNFKEMHRLWQEAAFSQRQQSDENREKMETFVKESVDYLWDQADFKERMRIRYRYAL